MFDGFSDDALEFFAGLEADNSKSYWNDRREVYDNQVRAPMEALLAVLEPEFGTAKIFRPHRDVRFSKDKSPYKTEISAVVGGGGSGGYYLQLSAKGLYAGGGRYALDPEGINRYRAAVLAPAVGGELATIVAGLRDGGYSVEGDTLVRVPRGMDPDHPRADLLRHKSLYAAKDFGRASWLGSGQVVEEVREAWEGIRPLHEWFAAHS